MIYVGKDKRFLLQWWAELDKLGEGAAYLWSGCGLPDYLHRTGSAGLTVLGGSFSGASGDDAL